LHSWILYHLRKILALIPDANTFLPPICPNQLKKLAKNTRPVVGKLRRSIVSKNGTKPVLQTSGSWLFLHEMYRKDIRYKHRIEEMLKDEKIFPSCIFDLGHIKRIWEGYLAGNRSLHYEIQSLISFGSLHALIPSSGIKL